MIITYIIIFFAGVMTLSLISKYLESRKTWTAYFDSEEGVLHEWEGKNLDDVRDQYSEWIYEYVGFKYQNSVDFEQWMEEINDAIMETECRK